MSMTKMSLRSIAAKQIVDLQSGRFVNGLAECLISPEEKEFAGINIDEKVWFPKEKIKSFHADVIIAEESSSNSEEGLNPIGMPAVTKEGQLIGRILDVAIDEEGRIIELLLDGGLVREKNKKAGILSILNVDFIGVDVFICSVDLNTPSFADPDKEIYKLALSKSSRKKVSGSDDTLRYEEVFDQMTKHISHSMSELGVRISDKIKNVDKESISQELNRFTESLNREAGKFMDGFMDQFAAHKKEANQKDIDAVFNDLGGKTVKRPVNDKNGQVIIMPGQVINEEKIRNIMLANKVAELYRMSVPLNEKETVDDGEDATEK